MSDQNAAFIPADQAQMQVWFQILSQVIMNNPVSSFADTEGDINTDYVASKVVGITDAICAAAQKRIKSIPDPTRKIQTVVPSGIHVA